MTIVKKYFRQKDEVEKKALVVRINKPVMDNLDEIDERLSSLGMSKTSRSEVVEDLLKEFAKKMELELKSFPEVEKTSEENPSEDKPSKEKSSDSDFEGDQESDVHSIV